MERNELLAFNRAAWNHQVQRGNRWTVPTSAESIAKARDGNPEIVLTPQRIVPRHWFPNLTGCRTLMLASGGGQQSPIMAAAGAEVTVVDLSEAQLAQDQSVAKREGLTLTTIRASMDDLSALPSDSFELVIHPCSNCYVPDLRPVWDEVARVTCPNAVLMTGFCNPAMYLFDSQAIQKGRVEVAYTLPYSDQQLPPEELEQLVQDQEPLMFGHTLSDQVGALLQAGFAMHDLYEDKWGPGESEYGLLDRYMNSFVAIRCRRLSSQR